MRDIVLYTQKKQKQKRHRSLRSRHFIFIRNVCVRRSSSIVNNAKMNENIKKKPETFSRIELFKR